MTNNVDRATNLLANSEFEGRTLHPAQARAIVHAFKDAGLLMPDLPDYTLNSNGNPLWKTEYHRIEQKPSGEVLINRRTLFYEDELRQLALVLLAAENEATGD